jgi:DNA invertase Pin-like site-specific DNA recombinase
VSSPPQAEFGRCLDPEAKDAGCCIGATVGTPDTRTPPLDLWQLRRKPPRLRTSEPRRPPTSGPTRTAISASGAIEAFAKRAGYELVDEFYDAAVSGADPIGTRPGFAAMLERIEGNGVRTIIVETASRFARDLMVQEVGHAKLRERGVDLIAVDSPGSFIDDTPTAKLVRQVLGAISEFDKPMTVAKLRGARERKRRETGKCEGRKSHAERNPELVALAKRLHRQKPKGGRRSLRAISAELAAQGFLNENGRPFAAASVKSMLA